MSRTAEICCDEDVLTNPFDISSEVSFYWMEGDSLAPPCQTDNNVIATILRVISDYFAGGTLNEIILYDLGCGDGRICLAATETFKCQSIGCEIEETLINKFRENVSKLDALVSDLNAKQLVKIVHADLREIDCNDASVIAVYLLPEAICQIKDKLESALRHGALLICNTWGLKHLPFLQRIHCGAMNNVTLYTYDRSCLEATKVRHIHFTAYFNAQLQQRYSSISYIYCIYTLYHTPHI